MDMTKDILVAIFEKLEIKDGTITDGSLEKIIDYIDSLGGDVVASPPVGLEATAYNEHLQKVQSTSSERMMKWQNHSVSYRDIKEWYLMTELEAKNIPNKTGKGMCPLDGTHWNINSQTEHYGPPNSVSTGSPTKLVCDSHTHLLNKRDQTRKIYAWANNNSGRFERKTKTWRVSEFPMSSKNRIMMFLEDRGDIPQNVQVYNQQIPQAMNTSNPMHLQAGTPGVIKCAHCGALCQQGAPLCPSCNESPTTGMQKLTSFGAGIAGFGVGILEQQAKGFAGEQAGQLPKYCPRCSVSNPGNSINCNNCGSSLSAHPPPPQQQGYSNTPQY